MADVVSESPTYSAKSIRLSVVILTYNEERNIARCLDSISPIADEIVVIDSFSTDRTAEICRRYPLKFITHPFAGHIEQKNWGLTQTENPYILSLDADESLDERLRQAIAATKKRWGYDGYLLNRLTNYCGQWIRHGGWYPDRKLRLFDRRKGRWTGTNPHDRYELNEEACLGRLEGNILHYSYYSIREHVAQTNYFTDLSAQAYLQNGKRARLVNVLFNPLISFVKGYFWKLGFLDGYYGFVISILAGQSTFLKYVKLRQLQQQKPANDDA